MFQESRRTSAFSVVEMLITLGILGVVALFTNMQLTNLLQSMADLDYFTELNGFKQNLQKRVHCDNTIAAMKQQFGGVLPPPGTVIDLFDRNQSSILGPKGAEESPFENTPSLGQNWYAKPIWVGSAIEVRVAKGTGSTYAKNPMTNQDLDFEVGIHNIFGTTPFCGPKASNRTLVDLRSGLSKDVNVLLNLPPNTPLSATYQKPIGGFRMCHEYCTDLSYITGLLVSFSDYKTVPGPKGELVLQKFKPGRSVLACRCLR